jgi:hypothetical protein
MAFPFRAIIATVDQTCVYLLYRFDLPQISPPLLIPPNGAGHPRKSFTWKLTLCTLDLIIIAHPREITGPSASSFDVNP